MNLDLTGKRALVGGASRGIGRAIAEELARLGASVVVMARDAALLEQVRAGLATSRGPAQRHGVLTSDTSKPETVDAAAHEALREGPVHIVINNTGGPPGGQAIDAKPEAFAEAFRNHILCNQTLAQALVPGMKDAKYGRIINIISTSVKQPIPGLGVSNTIRGAVASWAKTLSWELAPFGITVNNILPGFTDTDRLRSLIAARAKAGGKTEDAVATEMRSSVPMGRFGTADEIAAAAAFLATPAASYVNGVSMRVDGGRTMSI